MRCSMLKKRKIFALIQMLHEVQYAREMQILDDMQKLHPLWIFMIASSYIDEYRHNLLRSGRQRR